MVATVSYALFSLSGSTVTRSTTHTVSSASLASFSGLVVANVTVNSKYPQVIAVSGDASKIYVSDLAANNLTVLDASAYFLIGAVSLPGSPEVGVAIDLKSNLIYVPVLGCLNFPNVSNGCQTGYASASKGGIVKIDANKDSVVGEIPIAVDNIAIDSITGILYGTFGRNLLAINEVSGAVIGNSSLAASPVSIAMNSKTNMLYIAACRILSLGCEGGEILAVNGSNLAQAYSVPLNFNGLSNLVIDQTSNNVYDVVEGQSLTLVSIDGSSGTVRFSSKIGPCGAGKIALSMNSAQNRLYVVGYGDLVEVDAASGSLIGILAPPSSPILSVATDPTGLHVFLGIEGRGDGGSLVVVQNNVAQMSVDTSILRPTAGCLP